MGAEGSRSPFEPSNIAFEADAQKQRAAQLKR